MRVKPFCMLLLTTHFYDEPGGRLVEGGEPVVEFSGQGVGRMGNSRSRPIWCSFANSMNPWLDPVQEGYKYLGAFYLAFLNGVLAFFLPAYVGSDGDAEIANLAFKLKLLQCLEQSSFSRSANLMLCAW
ncbi:MAG: hypothetical protein CM1200mP22_31780 [Dehalococcoidia bacterium]|nr:MAG: hypothetical protein CM1200mP22_31780 [Dehalococcoidia bacterium]